MLDNLDEAYFYHYEREQAERDQALRSHGHAAERHLRLAELHRGRRDSLSFIERLASRSQRAAPAFAGTDKEA